MCRFNSAPQRQSTRVAQLCQYVLPFEKRCAVTSPLRHRVPTAGTLEGRQCQSPLYEASEIPLSLYRALQPRPVAGASHARPTKRLAAPQICFSARPSWVLLREIFCSVLEQLGVISVRRTKSLLHFDSRRGFSHALTPDVEVITAWCRNAMSLGSPSIQRR